MSEDASGTSPLPSPDAEERLEGPFYQTNESGSPINDPREFDDSCRLPLHLRRKGPIRGRPSKAQIKAEKKLAVIVERHKPTVEELEKHQGPFTWGGRRLGAGRKKGSKGKTHLPARKLAMVRMDPALAAKLEALPVGKRSEYVRQALDLMSDIQPPEKFLASGKRNGQGAE